MRPLPCSGLPPASPCYADLSGENIRSQSPDIARMWRAEDLGGLELLRATLTEFAFRPHAHEEFFIALTEGGLAAPTYRGGTHVIGPGDLTSGFRVGLDRASERA